MLLRSADAGQGQIAVDGLQLGADVTLPDGWALKFTVLAGQTSAPVLVSGLAQALGVTLTATLKQPRLNRTPNQTAFTFARSPTACSKGRLGSSTGR